MAESNKRAFALAERACHQMEAEGALAVIVAVAMPDGRYHVMHQRTTTSPLANACLDRMAQVIQQEGREGWPAARFPRRESP